MTSDRIPPKIENAPGLVMRPRAVGWSAMWQARTDLVDRGFSPKSRRICLVGEEPTDTDRNFISDQCNLLQSEMLLWGRGGTPIVGAFDGTLRGLIRAYQTDPDSSYRSVRYNTRCNYDNLLRRIDRAYGAEELRNIKARAIKHWHEQWASGGHIPTAHSLVAMLRTLFTFGSTLLEDSECERLSVAMHNLRFKMGKPRQERLTAEQVIAIRKAAHEMGYPILALAQALQFELMIRQKDVVGEWVPQAEPGISDVVDGDLKWLRGLRWSEIDGKLVLKHTQSKTQADMEVDLHNAPMVMEELALQYGSELPASGPIIISAYTQLPYHAQEFRRVWRVVATAAGVPKEVFNMDSRAGGITEATDAGVDLEYVRHAAKHTNISMTQRYSRGSVDKVAEVMQRRAAHRNKPGTK